MQELNVSSLSIISQQLALLLCKCHKVAVVTVSTVKILSSFVYFSKLIYRHGELFHGQHGRKFQEKPRVYTIDK